MTHLRVPIEWSTDHMTNPSWMVSFSTIARETGQPTHLGTAVVVAASPEDAYQKCQDLGIAPWAEDPAEDPDDRNEAMVVGPVDADLAPFNQPFDVLLTIEEMEDLDLEPVSLAEFGEGW